jgi:hypothetical protein
MKKLFTLIAAAFLAVSMNAKTQLEGSWNPWSDAVTIDNGTINFSTAWSGAGFWLGSTPDFSNYECVWVELADVTADLNFCLEHGVIVGEEVQVTEDSKKAISASCSAGSIAVGVDISNDADKAIVAQVWLQAKGAGSATVLGVYAGTIAEYEEAKGEGPSTQVINYKDFASYVAADDAFVLAAGGAGWHSKWFGELNPAGFNSLVIEVASTTGDVQLVLQGTPESGVQNSLMITASETPKTYYVDLTGWENISQMAFQNFNFPDPTIEDWSTKEKTAVETKMVITAMYLSKELAPSEDGAVVIWSGEEVFNSWGSTIVIEADKFADAAVGDIIRVNFIDKGSDYNPIYKHVSDWSDFTELQSQKKDGDTYFEAPIPAEALAELQSSGLRFQGLGFTIKNVELIKFITGINSAVAEKTESAPAYNVAGQKVSANYKGIVIRNGKKYVVK